jgi:RNA polymerase sigma factor (sigma-70 family)
MRPPTTVATDEELLANTACLRRLARQLVGRDEADDLVQDTWAATFAHRPGADRPVRLWLLEVMRNFARMRRRRERLVAARHDQIATAAIPSGPTSADELLERLEVSRVLVEELSRLPEPYRATALLRYFDNRSSAEIARIHGVPEGTVRWRLKRALELLRGKLDSRFDGDRRAWVIALGPFARVPDGTLATLGPLLQGGLTVTAKTKVLIATGAAIVLLLSGALVWRAQRPSTASRSGDVQAIATGRGLEWVVRADDRAQLAGTGRSGGLAVEVVDAQGVPVVGATLSLARGLGASGFELSDFPRPMAVSASDGSGRFRFQELAAGNYTLTATRQGLASGARDGIAVDDGRNSTVRLTLAPSGLSLAGRILDSASGVIPGARVVAQLTEHDGDPGAPPRYYSVTSSTDGAYGLVLGPGRYTLRVEAAGYAGATDYVVLGAAITKDIVMEAAAALSGRVVDRLTRQPVTGAAVQARLVEGWNLGRSKPVTTDDGGAFHLVGLGPGDYVVDVRSERLSGRSRALRLAPGQARDGILVEIDAGHSVSGRVIDAGSARANAATVLLSAAGGAAPSAVVSDASGAFRFDAQLPGRYEVTARTPDGRRGRLPLTLSDADVLGVQLVLAPQIVVEGQVLDPAGRPVEGARVNAFAEPASVGWVGRSTPSATTTSDGRFRFTGFEKGSVNIRAEKGEAGTGSWSESLDWGATRQITIQLLAGGSLSGSVRFDDGTVAPGAVVYTEYPDQRERSAARTVVGDDGRYLLRGLGAGLYRVTASRSGGHMRFRPDVTRVQVSEGEQKHVDLIVPRRQTVRGLVLLPDGKPAAGAVVIVGVGDYKPLTGSALRGVAEVRGRFTVDDLDQDQIYTLWADLAGYSEAKSRGILAGNQEVVLELLPEAGVAGVVVDQEGRSVADFELVTTQEQLPGEAFTPMRRLMEAVHDPAGSFLVRPLPPSTYRIQARSPTGRTGESTVSLAAGERRSDVRIVLGGLMTVRGTVLDDATGVPMAGIRVGAVTGGVALPFGPTRLQSITNAAGGFLIREVPHAKTIQLTLAISDRGYLPETEFVVAAASAETLDVGPMRLIRGNMMDRFGTGPRGMTGIDFARQGDRVVLTQIRPKTPAEEAGLRVGDRLVAIDGRPIDGLGHTGRSYLVAGKPGTPVVLLVQTGNAQPRPVTLIRAPAAPVGPPRTGTVPGGR